MLLLNYAMCAALLAGVATLGWWSIRSRESLRALRRYPALTQLRVMLPWQTKWEGSVAASDLPVLQPIRRGFIRYYLFCVVPVVLLGVAGTALSYNEYLRAKSDLAKTQRQIEALREHADGPVQ
jgi:hypothetical protein